MATTRFNPAAMYGITRPSGGRDGPAWKVLLTRNGVLLTKTFAFSMFGGEAAALAQAQAWRDDVVRRHPPMTRQQLASQRKRNNTSGVPGVTCLWGTDGQPSGWVAKTSLSPANVLSKYFSVSRYGPQAKSLAAERKRQLEQVRGLSARP